MSFHIRYVLHDEIKRLEHRTRIVKSVLGPDGLRKDDTVSDGWWMVLQSGIAVSLGMEEPMLSEGPVQLVVEQ